MKWLPQFLTWSKVPKQGRNQVRNQALSLDPGQKPGQKPGMLQMTRSKTRSKPAASFTARSQGFSKEKSKALHLQLQSAEAAFRHLSKIERKAFFVVMLSTAKVFRAGAVRKILKNYTLGAFVIFC